MKWRMEYDGPDTIRIRIGGEVWQREGQLSGPEIERLARAIATTNGAAWVLTSWGFAQRQDRSAA